MNQSVNLQDLITAVRAGDSVAFEALLNEYRPLLIASVTAFRGSSASHDELMQEARYALFRAALSYSGGGVSFGLYAKICIRNALVSVMRREGAESLLSLDGEGADTMLADGFDMVDDLIRSETVDLLQKEVCRVLSAYEREVFLLYARGYSAREIAASLRKGEKSVQNALSRIFGKVRRLSASLIP